MQPTMRIVARVNLSNELAFGGCYLPEIGAMGHFEAFAIIVVFVLVASLVIALVQTRRR